MKTIIPLILLSLASILVVSCSTLSSNRTHSSEFKLRSFEEIKLDNGLTVLFIQDSSLPRVSLNMLIKVGAVNDPQELQGLTFLTSSLLEDGTTKRSATRLADDFAFIGSDIEITAGTEMTTVSASSLSDNKDKLLELYAEVVQSPLFSEQEIKRKKSQTLSSLKKLIDNPQGYADFLLAQTLFPNHPYGRLAAGTEQTVPLINKSEIIKHYFNYYRPNNSILAVVGAWDQQYKEKIIKTFSAWQKKDIAKFEIPVAKDVETKEVKVVQKAGLKQAQVRMGHLALSRPNPDFLKLRVANLILGGAFASRLNQKVRDDLGLTYSISSSLDTQKDNGSFEISTFTRFDKLDETIKQARIVYSDFIQNGITKKELLAAQNLLIGQFPASIETPDRLAYNLMVLRFYGVGDDYLKDFIKNVSSIKVDEVNQVIKKYLSNDKLKVVVFRD
jgi:zinc protease